jgi:Fe-S cluster biosynthesis and repair protein YggX
MMVYKFQEWEPSRAGIRPHAIWVLRASPLESRVGIHAAVGGQEEFSMAHVVKCVKLGREMEGLDEPPFDGELGQRIYNNVSKLAWEQWQEHMKMLLNEYRLQPWKKEHQEFIVQQMDAYFFGEGAEKPKEYVPPTH